MPNTARNEGESDYNKKYYAENKQKILKRRLSRYREDDEFRTQRQEYARVRRRVEREVEKRKRKGLPPKKRTGPVPPKIHRVDVNGTDIEVMMYSTGHLAASLKKSIKTIRAWEAKGLLPEALYRGSRNMRLYTELQMELILDAYMQSLAKDKLKTVHRISSSMFAGLVKKIWQDYPLGIDLSA